MTKGKLFSGSKVYNQGVDNPAQDDLPSPPPVVMFPPSSTPPPSYSEAMGGGEDAVSSSDEFAMRCWDDKAVRRVFVRKVYLILMLQLLVTFTIVMVFTYCNTVQMFVKSSPAMYWSSYAVFVTTYLILCCCTSLRRKFPYNIILLILYTLALSYLAGVIASFYTTQSVVLCLGLTALVCFSVTLFCFQTKYDFTSCHGLLYSLLMVVFLTGLVACFTIPFGYLPWLQTIYGGLGALLFTLFLVFDTQLLLGNRRNSLSPEEHVFAALSLYLDIIYIFTFFLNIFGTRN
uniref:protein lifeguard 2-like isoform X1 n=1 Tax=Myxine glutinosa TaxID=7769 RepID=UPI00358E294D